MEDFFEKGSRIYYYYVLDVKLMGQPHRTLEGVLPLNEPIRTRQDILEAKEKIIKLGFEDTANLKAGPFTVLSKV